MLMKKKVRYTLLAIIAIIVLGVGYYGISPIFRNIKADEALPQGAEEKAKNASSTEHTATVVSEGAQVVGTTGHPASGTARLVSADGKTYVRYENFKTLNGPDIYVYLSKDLDAKEYIDLGKVRATEGNINYEVPAGIDASEYRYVLTWCKTFSVLFNYADLFQE